MVNQPLKPATFKQRAQKRLAEPRTIERSFYRLDLPSYTVSWCFLWFVQNNANVFSSNRHSLPCFVLFMNQIMRFTDNVIVFTGGGRFGSSRVLLLMAIAVFAHTTTLLFRSTRSIVPVFFI